MNETQKDDHLFAMEKEITILRAEVERLKERLGKIDADAHLYMSKTEVQSNEYDYFHSLRDIAHTALVVKP